MRVVYLAGIALIALFSVACKGAKQSEVPAQKGAVEMAMTLTSTAFANGAVIPKKYTCDGEDVSPPLSWSGVPGGAKSLALIMDDPDAPMGTWVHWVMWGMPPTTPELSEGVPTQVSLSGGMKQGKNSWPRTGYGGPCPPPGKPHHYHFKLYALDVEIAPPDSANKAAVESAMKGHILTQAELVGLYGREK